MAPSERVKKEKKGSKKKANGKGDAASDQLSGELSTSSITNGVGGLGLDNGRSCTGVLASHPQSRDIHIDSFTLLYHGHMLLEDTRLELNYGR
jgi:ATP-binding cassette subfamily F protein 2